MEGTRDGERVAHLMSEETRILSREEVMDGMPEMIPDVQVEATFPGDSKLVTVHHPIIQESALIPGEMLMEAGELELKGGRPIVVLDVASGGDRPIQVGSHSHC